VEIDSLWHGSSMTEQRTSIYDNAGMDTIVLCNPSPQVAPTRLHGADQLEQMEADSKQLRMLMTEQNLVLGIHADTEPSLLRNSSLESSGIPKAESARDLQCLIAEQQSTIAQLKEWNGNLRNATEASQLEQVMLKRELSLCKEDLGATAQKLEMANELLIQQNASHGAAMSAAIANDAKLEAEVKQFRTSAGTARSAREIATLNSLKRLEDRQGDMISDLEQLRTLAATQERNIEHVQTRSRILQEDKEYVQQENKLLQVDMEQCKKENAALKQREKLLQAENEILRKKITDAAATRLESETKLKNELHTLGVVVVSTQRTDIQPWDDGRDEVLRQYTERFRHDNLQRHDSKRNTPDVAGMKHEWNQSTESLLQRLSDADGMRIGSDTNTRRREADLVARQTAMAEGLQDIRAQITAQKKGIWREMRP
jgi:hypothetical protein